METSGLYTREEIGQADNEIEAVVLESVPEPTTNQSATNDLIAQTTVELKRLDWSTQQGRLFLQENFGKPTRQSLTEQELQQFLGHLRSLFSCGRLASSTRQVVYTDF